MHRKCYIIFLYISLFQTSTSIVVTKRYISPFLNIQGCAQTSWLPVQGNRACLSLPMEPCWVGCLLLKANYRAHMTAHIPSWPSPCSGAVCVRVSLSNQQGAHPLSSSRSGLRPFRRIFNACLRVQLRCVRTAETGMKTLASYRRRSSSTAGGRLSAGPERLTARWNGGGGVCVGFPVECVGMRCVRHSSAGLLAAAGSR